MQLIALVNIAYAADEPVSLGLAGLVNTFFNWIIGIAGLVALAMIIYGGLLYSVSGGTDRVKEAKSRIQHAIVGLIAILSTYLFLTFLNPDLVTLQEVFIQPNPDLPTEGLDLGEGGNSLGKYYNGPDCDGFYHSRNAPRGNFGDPDCDYANAVGNDGTGGSAGRTAFVGMLRDAVINELETQTDYCQANVDWVTTVMVDRVAGCETGWSYNPNSYNPNSTSKHGAYGLFQMNPSAVNSPSDKGDVGWREQAQNAIGRYYNYSPAYWACWNRLHVSKLVSCEESSN